MKWKCKEEAKNKKESLLISQKITSPLIGETNLKHSFEMLLSMDWRLELKIMKKDFKLLLKVQDIQT